MREKMTLSSWFCTHSTKNMLVKIVHPGGHVELHDRPVLAAEIMLRNPRCCVTYPSVFQQPRAIVPPNTMLLQGQKFYVVPISTIRKLQRLSLKRSPSPLQHVRHSDETHGGKEEDGMVSNCWLFVNQNTPKISYTCLKQSDDDGYKSNTGSTVRKTPKEMKKEGCLSDEDNCFMCLLTGIKLKVGGEDLSDDTRSTSTTGSSETKELNKKRSTKDHARKDIKGSPKRHSSFDQWQPSLASITEE